MNSDQTRRKSRDISSRYLSTTVAPPPSPPLGPNHTNTLSVSPNHQKPIQKQKEKQKHKHKHTAFIRGLWPSSSIPKSSNENDNNQPTSLADHFRKEKETNTHKRSENSPVLSKQKSCSEFSRLEKHSNTRNKIIKHFTPSFGGRSMRFTRGRPSVSSEMSSSSSEVFDSSQVILPGRLSVDENALRRSSYYQTNQNKQTIQARWDSFSDNSESSDLVNSPLTIGRNSPVSYMAATLSSKRCDNNNVLSKNINLLTPMHSSPKRSCKTIVNKRGMLEQSLSSCSPLEWDSSYSPSRLGSPSFSSSKPPTSSSGKKLNILHMGLDLIKGKKGGSKLSSCSSSSVSPGLDTGTNMESVHQLRLLQNSWMQWRHANARAEIVHENLAAQSENTLLCGHESVAKLRQSVVQKRLQLQKEKQKLKLNMILHSQIKMLEAWGDMERRHMLDVSVLKDYLQAVVCMIPLIEGAKVDLESTTMAFQQSSNMVATIKTILSSVSPTAQETMVTLSELAEVVNQEKLLLEECFEHFGIISTLEIQERNIRCSIIAMESSY